MPSLWPVTDLHAPPARQSYLPGIIGGLGPLAHIEFERRLVAERARRGAASDQTHLEWVLVAATRTPDRTADILSGTDGCVASLVAAGRRLRRAGADFAVVPCNTSHAFRPAVERASGLAWIDLVEVTAEALHTRVQPAANVAILATTGTLLTELYHRNVRAAGFVPLSFEPGSAEQQSVMGAIYGPQGVKVTGAEVSAAALHAIEAALWRMADAGAAAAIAGCTELSIIAPLLRAPAIPFVDPLDVLAMATIDAATGLRPLPHLRRARPARRIGPVR